MRQEERNECNGRGYRRGDRLEGNVCPRLLPMGQNGEAVLYRRWECAPMVRYSRNSRMAECCAGYYEMNSHCEVPCPDRATEEVENKRGDSDKDGGPAGTEYKRPPRRDIGRRYVTAAQSLPRVYESTKAQEEDEGSSIPPAAPLEKVQGGRRGRRR